MNKSVFFYIYVEKNSLQNMKRAKQINFINYIRALQKITFM